MSKPKSGVIAWVDLTVKNAEKTKEFYKSVVGWESMPVNMGDYNDYAMLVKGTENAASGICNAKGKNADIPAQWMIYIVVEDLLESVSKVRELGGSIVAGPKNMGAEGKFAIIKDPAGAVCALFEPIK